MPVELPESQSREAAPTPPRPFVWLTLFVVFMLVGVVDTLLTWPKTEPMGSAWFWTRLLALPALAWAIAFGLRLYYFDEETDRLDAEKEVLEADRAIALTFAQEPLAVLGHAYVCVLGRENVGGEIAGGKSVLVAQTPHAGGKAIRHTALDVSVTAKEPERYRACFGELIERMSEVVADLPRTAPLDVRIHLPANVDQELLCETWETCWHEAGLRIAAASLLSSGPGLMALDEWLDIKGGPALEKFTLFVSVQLNAIPTENSAESAVGLLLGWAPLAARRGLKPLAMLHRPVEADETKLNEAVTKALLWGNATADQIKDIWQSGLQRKDKTALINSTSKFSLGASKADDLSGIHDIDVALGYPGVAAGWLAATLAIEHAAQTHTAQLFVWREGSMRLAVAQPMKPAGEAESSL